MSTIDNSNYALLELKMTAIVTQATSFLYNTLSMTRKRHL